MVEAVSQVKLTPNKSPVSDTKKDTPNVTPVASNLERTPQKDSVSVNGDIKTEIKNVKKSFSGWIIGAGAAIVGLGIYFLTRGKKGSKIVENAGQQVTQTVKKNVNDTAQKVEEAVATVVKKEEPKVKPNQPTAPVTPKKDVNTQPPVKADDTPKPTVPVQQKEPQPATVAKKETPSVMEIMQQSSQGNRNILGNESATTQAAKPTRKKTSGQKPEINKPKESPKPKEVKDPVQEPKKETIVPKDDVLDDGIIAASILGDDITRAASKKAGEIGQEVADDVNHIIPAKRNSDTVIHETVADVNPYSHNVNEVVEDYVNPSKVADEVTDVYNPYKVADDIYDPHEDDYLNVDGIADNIFKNDGIDDMSPDFTSHFDDYSTSYVDDIIDDGADIIDDLSDLF